MPMSDTASASTSGSTWSAVTEGRSWQYGHVGSREIASARSSAHCCGETSSLRRSYLVSVRATRWIARIPPGSATSDDKAVLERRNLEVGYLAAQRPRTS